MRDTPVVLLAVTVVGLVATVGMNFTVLIPPLAAGRPRQRRGRVRLPHDRVRARRAAAPRSRLVVGGRPRPVRIAAGAIVLGVASIALARLDVVPAVARR